MNSQKGFAGRTSKAMREIDGREAPCAAVDALPAEFRAAMAEVCTPISVVTTVEDGRPHGTTVSAFLSLSMAPPMVLVSLGNQSRLLEIVWRTGTFGLNVLAAGQSEYARHFGTKDPDKFDAIDWSYEHGVARLPGVAVWVAGTVHTFVEGGDHMLILGDVAAVDATEFAPLTYHAHTFGTHARYAEAS
ncbi:flavin reductase family protein [Nocardia sp. NBC_01499]|uniref:flavin reductase family protein n=1 Tax=Nocardia sp. NBC_01499 TaxID=2903597 RepID=UPI00386A77E8